MALIRYVRNRILSNCRFIMLYYAVIYCPGFARPCISPLYATLFGNVRTICLLTLISKRFLLFRTEWYTYMMATLAFVSIWRIACLVVFFFAASCWATGPCGVRCRKNHPCELVTVDYRVSIAEYETWDIKLKQKSSIIIKSQASPAKHRAVFFGHSRYT